MESSGPPPESPEPGQDQPAGAGSPSGDDPPLPSWYKPPEKRQDAPGPGGEPSPWAAPEPAQPAAAQGGEEPSSWAEPTASGGDGPEQPEEPAPDEGLAAEAARPEDERPPESLPSEDEPPAAEEQPAGDTAPLAPAAAAAAAARQTPAGARADAAEALVPPPPPEPAYPAAAVADAWSTQPETQTARWAPRYARGDHPHLFGDRMAAGVLLTLAAGSMIGGGLFALVAAGTDIDPTIRTIICGAVAAVLLAGAVALRLVRGTEDLRGTLAVTAIAYAAACLSFAWQPDPVDPHTQLVKAAMVAGLVTVLCWFAAVAVPSAVTGMLGVIALGITTGAAVWLLVDQPTVIEVFVAALGIGLAVALVLPRIVLLRPHPAGLGWALSGAALVVALPAIGLMARQDPLTMAAGATASAALLAVAQRHRNLPAALGAFAGLAYLEALLIATRTGATGNSPNGTTQLIIVAIVGVVLVVLVALTAVLARRARPWPALRRPWPVGITDLLLLAALVLALISLFTGNSNIPLNPNQLSPTQTTTVATTQT